MGLGFGGLQTNQRREPPGAPFTTGSAVNGTSIDASGRVVLGNDVGDPLAPAELTSDREVVTGDLTSAGPLNVIFTDNFNGNTIKIDGNRIELEDLQGNAPAFINLLTSSGIGFAQLALSSAATNAWSLLRNAGSSHVTVNAAAVDVMSWATTGTRTVQVGAPLVADNSAALQVTGTITYRDFTTGIGAGATNIDRDADSGKLFFNSAAAVLALPNLAGANDRTGFRLAAACNNAAGITFQFAAGQTCRFGSLVTSSGGTLSSTDVGAYAEIVNLQGGSFFTKYFVGAWAIT